MKQILTTQITVVRAAVLAVAAVVALFSSGVCRASCGDYVYSRFYMPADQTALSPGDRNSQPSELVDLNEVTVSQDESLPSFPPPCHGPNCHKSPTPSLPIAPPTTMGQAQQDRLVCGQLAFELPSQVSRRRDYSPCARALRGFPRLIEMPPKTAN